jgi:hypothetical protein
MLGRRMEGGQESAETKPLGHNGKLLIEGASIVGRCSSFKPGEIWVALKRIWQQGALR